MTPAQEGAYIRLLCYDWANDGIPDNDDQLAALSRIGREEWDKGGYKWLRQCFQPHLQKPGFLTNPRLQKEREIQDKWRQKSAEGGKKSAAKRWGKAGLKKNKGGYKMVTDCLQPNGNSSSSSSSSSSCTPLPPNGGNGDHLKDLPEKLNTVRMQNKWQVWMTHRRGFKKPKSWLTLFNEQIDWLGQYDEPTAFEILSMSIRNGYQGLIPPRQNGAASNGLNNREQIRLIEEAISKHPANKESVHYRNNPSERDRSGLKSLRDKLASLKAEVIGA